MRHDLSRRELLARTIPGALLLFFSSAGAAAAGEPLVATEEARLADPNAACRDWLGASVALHGDTALVGAHGDDGPGDSSGAAHVFVRSGTSWLHQAELKPSDLGSIDTFGSAVSLAGNRALISSRIGQAAYVFDGAAGAWSETVKLTPSDAPVYQFGAVVAVEGGVALVGASSDSTNGAFAGAAYVFEEGSPWSEVKVFASDGSAWDNFGASVAISGGTLLVGAPHAENGGMESGAVYVFVRQGSAWVEQARLAAADLWQYDDFGFSVALEGDTALIGAAHVSGDGWGVAYVFVRSGTTWSEQARLDSVPGGIGGRTVSLSGDLAVVGRSYDLVTNSSPVHVFRRDGTTWSEVVRINAGFSSDGKASIFGERVLIGMNREDGANPADPTCDSGAAYVFTLAAAFPSFCDASDGALASCPCGNPGAPDSGCDVAQATGGVRLDVAGFDGPGLAATLAGSGFPPAAAPTAIVIRANDKEATPVVFGDGLRCVGLTGFVRLAAISAVGGASTHVIGHGAGSGEFHYQLWFRNTPASFCNPAAFNLSSGRTITW